MTEHSEKLERQAAANKKWEEIQTKAFTHWVNSVLSKRDENIEDLQTGFSTGVQLVNLIEVLSGKKMEQKWTKKPNLKVHKINNCFIALKFLQEDCNVKGVTVSAEDLVNGESLVLILGFCWLLLRTFQEPAPETGEKGSSFEANLLNWLKEKLKNYKDIDFSEGFKAESFCNGKAFIALINEWKNGLVDYDSYKSQDKVTNCEQALKIAEEHIKLPSIIDPEELAEGKTSEKNLVLYLSLFYNAFKDQQSSENKDSLMKRLQDLEERVRVLTIENEALKSAIQSLTSDTTTLSEKLSVLSEEKTTLISTKEELETQLGELKENYSSETSEMKGKIEQLTQNISLLKTNTAGDTAELQNLKEELQKERDQIREELKKTKEKLTKEKEELTAANEQLKSNLKRNDRVKAELEEIMNKQKNK